MPLEPKHNSLWERLKQGKGRKILSFLLLFSSILASLGGVAAFIYLFVLDWNVYWWILSPIIFALYQIPAVFLYWLRKNKL
ncbi:hypothetical protein KGY73_01755 [bacterium]|nr:hypothetical protein [bacterium]